MGLDQKGTPVFCVKPGTAGQWNVLEEGFEKPLATFEGREDAMKYAQDLAQTKEGSRVKAYDEDGNEQRQEQSARGSSGRDTSRGGEPGGEMSGRGDSGSPSGQRSGETQRGGQTQRDGGSGRGTGGSDL